MRKSAVKAVELMTKGVLTCSPDDKLNRAAQIMWEHNCGAVLVVEANRRTIGIITDRDICMAAYTQGKPLWEIPVSAAAAYELISALPDDTIESVEALMRSAQIRRVPVLDKGGRAVGIISMADIARRFEDQDGGAFSANPIARTLAAISGARAAPPRAALGPVYHVKSVDGGWEVFDRRGERVSERMDTQSEAVIHAKELARGAGSAQIIVHDKRGSIQSEFFYGKDERSALASDDTVPTMAASRPVHARRARSRRTRARS
jgi:CBS domain-containing protein